MNISILIEAIVRQTTVLIAQLATSAGGRASLSQTANQVFASLVNELKEQGLGNKLIADMFGLSLRTYHNKMRRLSESSTEQGESLWMAVLEFVREKRTVTRDEVVQRFRCDDERIDEVLGFLASTRRRASKLRAEVDRYDENTVRPVLGVKRVIAYVGQTVVEADEGEE